MIIPWTLVVGTMILDVDSARWFKFWLSCSLSVSVSNSKCNESLSLVDFASALSKVAENKKKNELIKIFIDELIIK